MEDGTDPAGKKQQASARRETAPGAPALPGEECRVAPHERWSEAEKWVWGEICAGRIADFNERYGMADPLDPSKLDGWANEADARRLGPAFLETVLLHEPWRSATPRQGVLINGALFSDPLDLSHARLTCQLWLERCRFESKVNLAGIRVDGWLSLEGSSLADVDLAASNICGYLSLAGATVWGDVKLIGASISGPLSMRGSTFKGDVNLCTAKAGGQITMNGATFEGAVNMDGLEAASSLFMSDRAAFKGDVIVRGGRVAGQVLMAGSSFEGTVNMNSFEVAGSLFMNHKATFKGDVDLHGAKVGGQLEMDGSAFEAVVEMDSLEVVGSLFMGDKATFNRGVRLHGAKVGGHLEMDGATFEDAVTMDSLTVTGSLFIRHDAHFAKPLALVFAKIDGNLDISGGEFCELDLTGTQIAGELRMGSHDHRRTLWPESGGMMVLRNTHAGALQDRVDDGQTNDNNDAWPAALQLDGFIYDRLGGFSGGGDEADMLGRNSTWYAKDWLERDPTYSPQPYEQLAGVFRAAGHTAKAQDILYAGRERARQLSTGIKWLGLTALKLTIGYGLGIRYFRALWWVAGFTILGAVMHWWGAGQASDPDIFRLAWLSFDQLLPIAELDEDHASLIAEGVLNRWALAYFYIHKLVGWLLASFLIAGFSGLTQK